VPAGKTFLYDDLIVKLYAQGRTDFDRAAFGRCAPRAFSQVIP
jgi:hypothetical protein